MEYQKTQLPSSTSSACGCIGGCCEAYESPLVQELLGDSFHPGGIELTHRSIASLDLPAKSQILDIACGIGTSAIELSKSGYKVLAIDASQKQIDDATKQAGENPNIQFIRSTADEFENQPKSLDGIFCECAFSLMSDQNALSKKWFKFLRPKGRIAISDMVVNAPLPKSLQGTLADWACLGNARSREEYENTFRKAGFTDIEYIDERDALLDTISAMKRKLLMYGIGNISDLVKDIGVSLTDLTIALRDANKAAKNGTLSYCRISATKS